MIDNLKDELEGYNGAEPTSHCSVKLTPDKGKEYVDVAFFSDMHIGCKFCDFGKVKEARDYFLKNRIHVLLGGDLIEGSTRYSIGAGIYEQVLTPTEQFHALVSFFKPLVDEGLVISAIRGNHENRFYKTVGLDITSILCERFNIPYLGVGGFNFVRAGNINYKIYYMHGNGAGKFFHTKAKKVTDGAQFTDCDIYAWGHVHELAMWHDYHRKCTSKRGVEFVDKLLLMTGHYLKHSQSYADEAAMKPSRMGSPIVRLSTVEKNVREYII